MTADAGLLAALRDLQAALAASGRPAMIIGGIAVLARGVPRQTIDIDATIAAEGTDLNAMLETLAWHGIVPRIADALTFARDRQVLLLRHEATETPLGPPSASSRWRSMSPSGSTRSKPWLPGLSMSEQPASGWRPRLDAGLR